MISLRGIAMSLAIHGVAAALISASAAIQPEAPVEDVAAIPVELVLEMESAPVNAFRSGGRDCRNTRC